MTQTILAIKEAEKLITRKGGEISPEGEIKYDGENPNVLEAIDFLVEQCDYVYKK
jgi:hypothetical protein